MTLAALLVARETYEGGCAALEVDRFVAIDSCVTTGSTLKWANHSKTSRDCHTKLADYLRTNAGINPNTTSVAATGSSDNESAPSFSQLGGSANNSISNRVQGADESAKSKSGGLEVGDHILLHVAYSNSENNRLECSIAEDCIKQQTTEKKEPGITQDCQIKCSPGRSARGEGISWRATSTATPPRRAGSCPPLGRPAISPASEKSASGECTSDRS